MHGSKLAKSNSCNNRRTSDWRLKQSARSAKLTCAQGNVGELNKKDRRLVEAARVSETNYTDRGLIASQDPATTIAKVLIHLCTHG